MSTGVFETPLEPLGHEQITGLSTVKALTIPAGADYALLQAETQTVRYRDDGTAPTASVGQRIIADSQGIWYTAVLNKLSFIEEAASAVLNVAYYRVK